MQKKKKSMLGTTEILTAPSMTLVRMTIIITVTTVTIVVTMATAMVAVVAVVAAVAVAVVTVLVATGLLRAGPHLAPCF